MSEGSAVSDRDLISKVIRELESFLNLSKLTLKQPSGQDGLRPARPLDIASAALYIANGTINKKVEYYGPPEENMQEVANFWSAYLGGRVDAYDVAIMMALYKIARLKNDRNNIDTSIDLVGYSALATGMAVKNQSET